MDVGGIDAEAAIQRDLAGFAIESFDLETGPVIRGKLYRIAADDHILMLVMHHIVSDGWSMEIAVREWCRMYAELSGTETASLPALPVQYIDYAEWQSQLLEGGKLDAQRDYWRKRLGGDLPLLQLPTDRPRPAVDTFEGGRVRRRMQADLLGRLEAIAAQHGATLFMVFLAAYQLLLARLSGQTDIVVGTPIAGRQHPQLQNLIGFLTNTIVARGDLSGNPRFTEFLRQVRESCMEGYANQDYPFDLLVESLEIRRDLSCNAVFNATFSLSLPDDRSPAEYAVSELSITPFEFEFARAKFDLGAIVSVIGTSLDLELEYNSNLFDKERVAQFAGYFEHVLHQLTEDPAVRVEEVELLDTEERQQVVEGFNASRRQWAVSGNLASRFFEQVARYPDRAAVVCGEGGLTYRELGDRVARLGAYLRSLELEAEEPVAVCLERSEDMVVAILAVLEAGGCYLPVEPAYPQERVAFMASDARVRIGIGKGESARQLLQAVDRVICLETDRERIEVARSVGGREAQPEHLAYIIYTSGSTGRPKGSQLTHANVMRLFDACEAAFGMGPEDVWSLFHSYCFDFSVWEIFGALLYGGKLVVVTEEGRLSPQEFAEVLEREGVTMLSQTPSAFVRLMDHGQASGNWQWSARLRRVVFGGEALEYGTLRPWFQHRANRQTRLVNMYGITETTVHVTYREVEESDVEGAPGRLVGRPLGDLRAYILDEQQRPQPIGVAGELYIGGAGLARGYLGRAALTAERFVPDGFGSEAGGRLYRTGDRARWRGDGEIEYLGRTDLQVKIRGHRIEPGEIEAALLKHPAVRQAVVIPRKEAQAGQQLVAYVAGPSLPGVEVLRGHLRAQLPDFMIPGQFHRLPQLPLTANGKVDRSALSPNEAQSLTLETAFAAPRDDIETQVALIWQQVLGVERVGIHDNFFDIGGDSILSIQIVARLSRLKLAANPKMIFTHQTIAELVPHLEQAERSGAPPPTVGGDAPLTPIQQWFFEQDLARPAHWNQSFLFAAPALRPDALQRALQAIVDHHEALRLSFRREGGRWRQSGRPTDEPAALTMIDLAGCDDPARAMTEHSERLQRSLDIEKGPLIRAALYRTGRAEDRLLVVIHHLVVDGVSWRILLEDLACAYGQALEGRAISLGSKTASYMEWARHLEQYSRSAGLQSETGYWKSVVEAPDEGVARDYDRGEPTLASSAHVIVRLDGERTSSLLHEARDAYHTDLTDLLLTAVMRGFHRWRGIPS
ncbi:MAG TPA: amino acid adenylation domain-containing protein, partial [Candidatus Solibacter sp.]|nr:amino acid adenylation domain-containing protein [Candidatus Solibacter sp.]